MEPGFQSRAFGISFTIFLFLCVGTYGVLYFFPIPASHVRDAFYIILFLALALMTVAFHQSLVISMSARSLARHMTKEMLIYSREFFSELYRGSPVPYVVTSEEGVVESINLAAARFFGVTQDALDGENIYSFFVDDDEEHKGALKSALIPEYFKRNKYVNDVEMKLRRPDGVIRWVMLSLFPSTDAQGNRKGMLTLVDITKQKQVDKAKTEFVSLASHQLRTPISGMKWNLELLEGSEGLSEGQKSYLTKIRKSAERMDSLVTDFLSVSKIDLGTFVPAYATVDMQTFFSGVRDEYSESIARKSLKLKTGWPQNGETMRTDTHLLQMAVSNLFGNAVKYTNDGGAVGLNVSVDSSQVRIVISDTGIGIPLADQEMLFSKLYRASNARTLVTDGTGLGLYIVKEIVRILGGTISFVSKEGEGSTFTVVLPKDGH